MSGSKDKGDDAIGQVSRRWSGGHEFEATISSDINSIMVVLVWYLVKKSTKHSKSLL